MGHSQTEKRKRRRKKKNQRERGGAKRGTTSAEEERGSERNQREGEKVSVHNEGETQTDRREERAVRVVFSHSAALH